MQTGAVEPGGPSFSAGTSSAERPPHRSRGAQFTHRAPTLGFFRRAAGQIRDELTRNAPWKTRTPGSSRFSKMLALIPSNCLKVRATWIPVE